MELIKWQNENAIKTCLEKLKGERLAAALFFIV